MEISPAAITTHGITKHFGEVVAVKDLSLNIQRGEIYGFLGLNGAGKTTTIRMLLGMIRPSAGDVFVFGTRVRPGESSIWGRVGYLVETPHAYPELTVRENLEIVRRLRKMHNERAVDEVMEELGLAQYARRRARTLSLGNAQRLGLAKALIHHPDLIILDEPANGLDPAGIVEIRNLLRDLAKKKGVTVFISSHILSEVAQVASRIGIIHRGKLVKELDAGTLAQEEGQHLAVDVRDANIAISALEKAGIAVRSRGSNSLSISDKDATQHPEKIATLLVQAGSPPSRLVVEEPDLESYFLGVVGVKETAK
jgi:ABC-2 type transport system ATP-binding protein